MVQYTLELKIKKENHKHFYKLDLTEDQEDNPGIIFHQEIRESMRSKLQENSSYAIKNKHLDQMINYWIEDIAQGYRSTTIELDLPLLIEDKLVQLNDQGNQEKPEILPPDLSIIEPSFGVLPPLESIFN
jgi:glycyl-tRNA synthetase (class II)